MSGLMRILRRRSVTSLLLWLVLSVLHFSVLAAEPESQATETLGQETMPIQELNIENQDDWELEGLGKLQVAPVVVDGDILFNIIGIASAPAKQRAETIVQRIEALALKPAYDPAGLHIVATDQKHTIFRDQSERGPGVMTIWDEDAALEGIGRDVVAQTFREKIKKAILDYRRDRDPDVILRQSLNALARTLVLIAILWGVIWGFRRLDDLLESRLKRQIEKLETRSMRIIQAEHLWKVLRGILKVLRVLIILFLIYLFLNFVLSLFPWTKYLSHTLLHLAIEPLRALADAFIDYVPSLIFLIIVFFIARYTLKVLRGFFLAIGRGSVRFVNFEAEWAIPTYRILRALVIVFALVLAYPYIPGSDSEAFKGISILLGILFSLGSTSMISNIIAGYAMTYRRAFRIGDRVRIGDTIGDVADRRVLVTHIRTLKNEEVVIPNSTIMNAEITNYSTLVEERGLILHTTVGIGYEVPWRQVEAMLLMAADRTQGLMKEPTPFVLQTALADFAVNYELNVYCGDEKRSVALYSDLHRNIQDVFNEYGVQIMTPAYERDTPDPKLVPKDQWYTEPAAKPD